jgi:hypothetical protein
MTNQDIDKKIEFMKAVESVGYKHGTYKLIFKPKGKYGKPEAWFYHKYSDGIKGLGYLLEEDTI